MNYKDIRKQVETLGNKHYEDFVKAVVSFEKGINDMNALDEIYAEFMDSDTKGLLHEDFDYMIDELKEQGKIKDEPYVEEERDDLVNLVGNVIGDAETVHSKNSNGEPFTAVNFTVVSKDDNGEKHYANCSAYGDKGDIPKLFKKGDFVKLFGQVRTSVGDDGKEYTNIRILSSKLLKAKSQMKDKAEKKPSVLGQIKEYQNKTEAKQTDSKVAKIDMER